MNILGYGEFGWIFPVIMMVLCFVMMRRGWCGLCGHDHHRRRESDREAHEKIEPRD